MHQESTQVTEPDRLQRELHLFNNQLFRISLLSEALHWKFEEKGEQDENLAALLGKIKAAVMQVSKSARKVNRIVKEETGG